MPQRNNILRTLGYAEMAFGHLKAHGMPASPKNYEFWYNYAAGFNRTFNRAVDGILRERDRITPDDLQQLYETFLSQGPLGDRFSEIGGKVKSEISEMSERIDTSLRRTDNCGLALRAAGNRLSRASDDGDVRAIIDAALDATQSLQNEWRGLRSQLAESRSQLADLQVDLESIRCESLNDPLTSLGTRKHFDQSIERAIAVAEAEGTPLSLLFADIDHFKSFNDRYGHLTGDHVLQLAALAVRQNIRDEDLGCRYGGEEFAIILPGAGTSEACIVGERIREAVMSKDLIKRSTGENVASVTVSIGIATRAPGDTIQSLIERADAGLYSAKRAGRNCVVFLPALEEAERITA